MVEHTDVEELGSAFELFGELVVGYRWVKVAGGVVVYENESR